MGLLAENRYIRVNRSEAPGMSSWNIMCTFCGTEARIYRQEGLHHWSVFHWHGQRRQLTLPWAMDVEEQVRTGVMYTQLR